MSSDSFEATIDVAPRASLRALTLLMILHGSLGLLLLVAQPPQPVTFALLAAIALSWLRLRRHPVFGFGGKALVRLTWHADAGVEKTSGPRAHGAAGPWTLHDAAGARIEAALEGDSLVLPGLLVLNFRCADGARRTRALLGDELEEESLKRLRARLKLHE